MGIKAQACSPAPSLPQVLPSESSGVSEPRSAWLPVPRSGGDSSPVWLWFSGMTAGMTDRWKERRKDRKTWLSHSEQGLQGLCKGLSVSRACYSVAAVGVFSKTHCLESFTLLLSVCSSFPVEAEDCGSTKPPQVCCWVPQGPHPLAGPGGWQCAGNGEFLQFPQKTELQDRATHSGLLYPGSWSSHPLYWLVSFVSRRRKLEPLERKDPRLRKCFHETQM